MAATIEKLGIEKLPVEEPLDVVHAIWDHIAASGPTPRLTDAQRLEIRRRVAEDEAHRDDLIPWEQVKADARMRSVGGKPWRRHTACTPVLRRLARARQTRGDRRDSPALFSCRRHSRGITRRNG